MPIEIRRDVPRIVLGTFAAISSFGCQIFSNPTNPDLLYKSLQGVSNERTSDPNDGFYKNREDFLNKNRYSLPLSILFGRDDQWVLQIAYGPGWVPGAFLIGIPGDENGLCTPATEGRIVAYQELFNDFQEGREAKASLVRAIREGAKPNCQSYFDK